MTLPWGSSRFDQAAAHVVSGGGFTPTSTESSNFLTRATGITSGTDKTRYDALITGLVTDTLFSKLDALWIFAAPTQGTAALNLVQSSFTVTEHGTPSFSANHGYTGNGSDFYLDTGVNPYSGGSWAGQYAQDSASVGVYLLNDLTGGDAGIAFAASDTVNTRLYPSYFDTMYWDINNGVTTGSTANSSTSGQWVVSRTGSTASAVYKNGSSTAFVSAATASAGVPRDNITLFGPGVFSKLQMSAAFIGSKLSNTEQATLAARINTFMTAYGINVY